MPTRHALAAVAVSLALVGTAEALLAAPAGYVAHHPVLQPSLAVAGPLAVSGVYDVVT